MSRPLKRPHLPSGPKSRRHLIDYERVKRCAAGFMSNREIAFTMGYSEGGFYEILREVPKLDEAIKEGRRLGLESATNALLHNIKERNFQAVKWFLSRQADNWRDEPQKIDVSMNLSGGVEIRERFSQSERDRLIEQYLREKAAREEEGAQSDNTGVAARNKL